MVAVIEPGGVGASADQPVQRKLRDLSDKEFRAVYDCERFTATVLSNKFRYIAAHMANLFLTQAFSPLIHDGGDMCAILSGPPELDYAMVAFSETVPLHFGSIPDAVPIAFEDIGRNRLQRGDVVFVNDYYRVGTHLNDACTIRPFFYGDRLLGAITIRGHLIDIGGSVMGGFEVTKRSVYEDGLRLAPIMLYSAGEPVESTFNLLRDNTRFPEVIMPDLRSQCAAMERADEMLVEVIDKYGVEAYVGAVRYACDSSAETMGAALSEIPDGVYEGEETIDGDGLADSPEYRVRVRIAKVGDRAEIDLHGSSHSTRSSLNCAWPDIKTAVSIALKFLLDPRAPITSGTLRNVDVIVPEQAIFNALPPTPCQYYWEIVMTIVHAMYRALNPVLGERAITASQQPITASSYGRNADGSEWSHVALMQTSCGPWGGTRVGDGDSAQQQAFSNLQMGGGVEIFERHGCGVFLTSQYVTDSAGPGQHRGGAGNAHDVMWRQEAEHRATLFHSRQPPAGGGVCGGQTGPTAAAWLFPPNVLAEHGMEYVPVTLEHPIYTDCVPLGGVLDPSSNQVDENGEYVVCLQRLPSGPGAIVRTFLGGGGGWGDALARDPELVLRDARDEYVSIAGAARDYGVVVRGDVRHPEQMVLDVEATEQLRAARRKQSLG